MYIATIPNRKSPPAILLRESWREGKQVKTKTLANLTHYAPERIEALRLALKGEFDGMTGCTPTVGKSFGTLFTLNALAQELGIAQALGSSNQGLLSLFLVLARIAHQGSRLSSVRWAAQHAVSDILGLNTFDENDLYEALDWLSSKQDQIEGKLFHRYVKQHGQPPALVLYDVTSSYLEGLKNELAAYGYNRDRKRGKKQIVIGLLTGIDGEPLSVRVFEGNTTDPTTVIEQINTLKDKWGLSDIIFVGDKGMIKRPGKAALTQAGWHYITALSKPEIRTLLQSKTIQLDLFDESVESVSCDDKRYVMRLNSTIRAHLRQERYQRQSKLLEKVEARNAYVARHPRSRPETGLMQLQRLAKTYRLHGYICLSLEGDQIVVNVDTQAQETLFALDGCYALETRLPESKMTPCDIDTCYHSLSEVEQNFRTMKTDCLEVRPIYLRNAARTRAHIFVCMLSLKITRLMRSKLSIAYGTTESNKYTVTLETALALLDKLQFLYYDVAGQPMARLSQPSQEQQRLLVALGVTLPAHQKKSVGRRKKIGRA